MWLTNCPWKKVRAIYAHNENGTITCLICGHTFKDEEH